jgi:hypothetical protein
MLAQIAFQALDGQAPSFVDIYRSACKIGKGVDLFKILSRKPRGLADRFKIVSDKSMNS